MGSFFSQGELAVFFVEVRAITNQFVNALRAFMNKNVDRRGITKACPGDQRILCEKIWRILIRYDSGYSALRITGIAIEQ